MSIENENQLVPATENKPAKKKRSRPDLVPQTEAGDNTRFLRHALAAWNLPPIDISDEEQVSERILWYFQHCAEDDMKPSVLGLANALGISRDTLWRWKTEKVRSTTHADTVKKAYDLLEQMHTEYMMNGKVNPVAGIFLAKNHFGYQDKQEVAVQPVLPYGDVRAPEEIAEALEVDLIED